MQPVHFQSIYRRRGQVICEPLCEQEPYEGIAECLSPLRSEITCPACLDFLLCIMEPTRA